jgi:hypothetical protein
MHPEIFERSSVAQLHICVDNLFDGFRHSCWPYERIDGGTSKKEAALFLLWRADKLVDSAKRSEQGTFLREGCASFGLLRGDLYSPFQSRAELTGCGAKREVEWPAGHGSL